MAARMPSCAALLLAACTHHRPIVDVASLAGKSVIVTTDDSEVLPATVVATTSGVEYRADTGDVLTPNQIEKVDEKRTGRGALEGLGLGVLIGTGTGVVFGLLSKGAVDAGERAVFGGVLLGGVGGLIGVIAGAVRGSRIVYENRVHVVPAGPAGSIAGITIRY